MKIFFFLLGVSAMTGFFVMAVLWPILWFFKVFTPPAFLRLQLVSDSYRALDGYTEFVTFSVTGSSSQGLTIGGASLPATLALPAVFSVAMTKPVYPRISRGEEIEAWSNFDISPVKLAIPGGA